MSTPESPDPQRPTHLQIVTGGREVVIPLIHHPDHLAPSVEVQCLRRALHGTTEGPAHLQFVSLDTQDSYNAVDDRISIYPDEHVARADGATIRLTPREFQLLHYLGRHVGSIVEYGELSTYLWNEPNPINGRMKLRPLVIAIRAALGPELGDTQCGAIRTARGIGYCLVRTMVPDHNATQAPRQS